MEWDDYYQMMRQKNNKFKVSDGIANFKKEGEAFVNDWNKNEKNVISFFHDLADDNR